MAQAFINMLYSYLSSQVTFPFPYPINFKVSNLWVKSSTTNRPFSLEGDVAGEPSAHVWPLQSQILGILSLYLWLVNKTIDRMKQKASRFRPYLTKCSGLEISFSLKSVAHPYILCFSNQNMEKIIFFFLSQEYKKNKNTHVLLLWIGSHKMIQPAGIHKSIKTEQHTNRIFGENI